MALFSSSLPVDDAQVVAAIMAAEERTSGEIRVLVASEAAENPVSAAQAHFERLGMTRTRARNGVLIYIAPRSHTFAVIGDTGVHEKCGDEFWRNLADSMGDSFRRGDFTAGLVQGVERAGALLAEHFPRSPDDRNELPDRVERA